MKKINIRSILLSHILIYPSLLLLITMIVTLPVKLDQHAKEYELEVQTLNLEIDLRFRELGNTLRYQNQVLSLLDSALDRRKYQEIQNDLYYRQ